MDHDAEIKSPQAHGPVGEPSYPRVATRGLAVFLLILLASSGCSRKKPPAMAMPGTQPFVGGGNTGAKGSGDLRPGGEQVYQGRSPAQWGEQLQSQNHADRGRATMALARMGEAGYPQLREGMQSKSPEVRLSCLQVISNRVLVDHRDEMLPILVGLLRDADPTIRGTAASRLGWFGAEGRSALPALQAVAEKDEDENVQQIARQSIEVIRYPNGRPAEKED